MTVLPQAAPYYSTRDSQKRVKGYKSRKNDKIHPMQT